MRINSDKDKKIFHTRWLIIAFIVLISSSILAADFSHVDDTVYNEVVKSDVISTESLQDSDSPSDFRDGGNLVIQPGEGQKMFSGPVELENADALKVSFNVENKAGKKAKVVIDLYADGFDDPYDEFSVSIPPGKESVSQEIAFYRDEHPDECSIRLFTKDDTDLLISDFKVDYLKTAKDNSRTAVRASRTARAIAIASLLFLVCYLLFGIKSKAIRLHTGSVTAETKREIMLYVCITAAVTVLLLALYRHADIAYPLVYTGGDEMGVFYFAKSIDHYGLALTNPNIGGLSGGDIFDYPYSDNLSFIIVRILGWFTDNPYLMINLFYFLNFHLIAIVSTAVSRKLGMSRVSSAVAGILFAFSPFIQMRYTHMWLTPYYMLPVACLLSINIIRGVIPDEPLKEKRKDAIWSGVILAFMCSLTGMYYAYFACALFAASFVIRLIMTQGKDIRKELYPLTYIASTITGVVLNILPNLLFWKIYGTNPYGELTGRNRGDAETYALKIVQLIMPRIGHRVGLFARIANGYFKHYPLVNENTTAAIGIVASAGLVISLLLLFSAKNKYKEISFLNLSVILIATVGGISSIISVAVPLPMRCYNRMSLVIMFLSLLMVGALLDLLGKKINPILAVCLSFGILLTGVYDQTVNYAPYDYSVIKTTQAFFEEVQSETEQGDMIFTLPYSKWPTATLVGSYGQFIGYIETDDLRWSYGAMQGREEDQWQKRVSKYEAEEMIEKLKFAGYEGIYLDRKLYGDRFDEEKVDPAIDSITKAVGAAPIVSDDGSRYFWKF